MRVAGSWESQFDYDDHSYGRGDEDDNEGQGDE